MQHFDSNETLKSEENYTVIFQLLQRRAVIMFRVAIKQVAVLLVQQFITCLNKFPSSVSTKTKFLKREDEHKLFPSVPKPFTFWKNNFDSQ